MKRILVSFFYLMVCSLFLFHVLNGVGKLPLGMGQTSALWGIDNMGKLFVQRSDSIRDDWKPVHSSQKIRTLALGRHLSMWALLHDYTVVMRKGISAQMPEGSSWISVIGLRLKDIAVGTFSTVVGITVEGNLVVREKITNQRPQGVSWKVCGTDRFKKISLSAHDQVWGLTVDGRLLFNKNGSTLLNKPKPWKVIDVPENFLTVEAGNAAVWALDNNHHVWVRTGISSYQPEGRGWKRLGKKKLQSLSVSPNDAVWGVHEKGMLLERLGITPTQKVGYAWKKIPGKLFTKVATTTFESEDGGGRSYTHHGSCESAAFHNFWRFKKRGKGWVHFSARTKSDLYLYLSSAPAPEKSYMIAIKPQAVAHQWISYWANVHNGVLLWGKKTARGNIVLGKIANKELFDQVKYVGFGGDKASIHEYKDIQTDGMSKSTDKTVILPRGFSRIKGKAQRIAVGNLDNRMYVVSVGFDHKLYEYDESRCTWKKMSERLSDGTLLLFYDVSVASDGTLVALDENGRVVQYNRVHKTWNLIEPTSGLRFNRVAVGNKNSVWALDKDSKNIYQLTSDGWQERATGGGMSLDVAADGTVVAINTAFDAYEYDYDLQDWQDLSKPVVLGRIAVGSRNSMWGTQATPEGFQVWNYSKNRWKRAKNSHGFTAQGLKQLSVNAQGDVFALDGKGNIYRNVNL